MNRPYVICHMQCSIDGKISGSFFFTPEADAAYERDNEIRISYKADALMNGAVTCAEIYADGFFDAQPDGGAECCALPREDYLARPNFGRFIVCLDPEGTLRWNTNQFSHRGNPAAHVIEVLTAKADDAYLSYLRENDISYIFADEENPRPDGAASASGKANISGGTELDLPLVLGKLRSLFGIERILLTGGGQTNRTFLDAGCIDELNLVILPFVAGNEGPPSAGLFHGPDSCGPDSRGRVAFAPAGFRLVHAERLPGDSLWLKYIPAASDR